MEKYSVKWCTDCKTYNSQIKFFDGTTKGADRWLYEFEGHNIIMHNFYSDRDRSGSICRKCLDDRLKELKK